MRSILFLLFLIITLVSCSTSNVAPPNIVPAEELKWEPLNPARGDKSPKAATIWGDRNGTSPTGFLVKFVDGFSSPPHIHNVSYRGVVIDGLVHNDDPEAAPMWMGRGSYWTQPKGEVHITAAKGESNIAYIEIEEGPYLVRPTNNAYDSGERPVNIDFSNIVWLQPDNLSNVRIAYLWGEFKSGNLNGTLLKIQSGSQAIIRRGKGGLRAIAIKGRYRYGARAKTANTLFTPGSSFYSDRLKSHLITCEEAQECIFYIRTTGRYTLDTD